MKALLFVTVLFAAACSGGSEQDGAASTVESSAPAATAASTTVSTAESIPATTVADTTVPDTAPATMPDTTAAPIPAETVDDLLALGRPIVLAHAAGEDEFPHSTPYGYAQSVAAGVDMLDLDVQLTGDGVLIVHHDGDVDRTTEGTGDVASMTYEEIAALDNAYWFTAECVCRDQPDEAYLYRGIARARSLRLPARRPTTSRSRAFATSSNGGPTCR